MTTKLIFSFDSEDYETPASDEAEKWWAQAMSRHGFTACICVVGELARALRDRGRSDVIAAMAQHEIAFHSNRHSAHPTWAEYLDVLDWDAGVRRALDEEGRGVADVRETFGQSPSAWCKPGTSWGPQIAEAMRRLNLPVFADAPFEWAPGEPLYFDNELFLKYHLSFDHYFPVPAGRERQRRMQDDFLELLDRHAGKYLVMYTHPCRLVTASFPKNFTAGANPPRRDWRPAPLRPAAEAAALQQDFEAFLEFVASRPEVEPATYRSLEREVASPPAWLSPRDLRFLLEKPDSAPLDFSRCPSGIILSPAEEFQVLARLGAELPGTGPVRMRPLPVVPTLGPLAPPAAARPGTVSRELLENAAHTALDVCRDTGAVPAAVPLGDAGTTVGPQALMRAVRRCLRSSLSAAPRRTVPIEPADETPEFARRPEIADARFQNTWSIFPPEFQGKNVLAAIRRQAWTAKPARLA